MMLTSGKAARVAIRPRDRLRFRERGDTLGNPCQGQSGSLSDEAREAGSLGACGYRRKRTRHDAQRLQSNIDELRITWSAGSYYEQSEAGMDAQWRDLIRPYINECDFSCVLELAPGHGRNTAKFMQYATRIDHVDINEPCSHACRRRFENDRGSCSL